MRAAVPALLVALAVALAGCTQVVPGAGTPVAAAPAAPLPGAPLPGAGAAAPPLGADGAAAAATVALQDFWRATFPATFGRVWADIAVFAPASPADAVPPPCVARADEVADQAYYCPAADAVVWDADGLVPSLYEQFGPVGVVVVLAHEIGHAVQSRLGLDAAQAADPQRYPTILLEAMADCYAGVALRHLADEPVTGLAVGVEERDAAVLTLVGFRDPLGVAAGDDGAHGNAFDRVSAFRVGHDGGPGRCSAMTVAERGFTQVRFGSAADRAREGNLPLGDLLAAVEQDARLWATELVAARAGGGQPATEPLDTAAGAVGWTAPPLATDTCPAAAGQGPVRLCPGGGPIEVDLDLLAPLHGTLGDFAGATLLSSRYGLAALQAVGVATEGPAAGHAAVCLAGVYAGRLLSSPVGFRLSPGDLDEAVQVLLADDWAARDVTGQADPAEHGYERVARYETGLRGGPAACGI